MHITCVLHSLHWLSFSYWVQIRVLVITYNKAFHGLEPSYLQACSFSCAPTRQLRSSEQCLLKALPSKWARSKAAYIWAFSTGALILWNRLPGEVRKVPLLLSCLILYKRIVQEVLFIKGTGLWYNRMLQEGIFIKGTGLYSVPLCMVFLFCFYYSNSNLYWH